MSNSVLSRLVLIWWAPEQEPYVAPFCSLLEHKCVGDWETGPHLLLLGQVTEEQLRFRTEQVLEKS